MPADLVQVVEWLEQAALPRSSVSRDELLYRAGWTAAEQHLARSASRTLRGASPVATVGWAAASALIATSLTAMFLSREPVPVGPTEPIAAQPPATLPRTEITEPSRQAASVSPAPLPPTMPTSFGDRLAPPRDYDQSATLLIQRDRALRNWQNLDWMSKKRPTDAEPRPGHTVPPQASPRSAREMLREFVPDVTWHEPAQREDTLTQSETTFLDATLNRSNT